MDVMCIQNLSSYTRLVLTIEWPPETIAKLLKQRWMSPLNTNDSYIINKEFVVSELMDGELTVINLEKGFYFIGKDSAVDIFLMLEEAMTLDSLVNKTLEIYSTDEHTARDEISKLLGKWIADDLVSRADSSPETPSDTRATADKRPWTKPIFIAFDDMRDLLLLDPIHDTELDQQGWPVAAENNPSKK